MFDANCSKEVLLGEIRMCHSQMKSMSYVKKQRDEAIALCRTALAGKLDAATMKAFLEQVEQEIAKAGKGADKWYLASLAAGDVD